MKTILFVATTAMLIIFNATTGTATDASVELGKQLFNDPTLSSSTNERSCNSCHAGGDGLKHNQNNPNLTKIINTCIVGPLRGVELVDNSPEMLSLIMYIESLGE